MQQIAGRTRRPRPVYDRLILGGFEVSNWHLEQVEHLWCNNDDIPLATKFASIKIVKEIAQATFP
jgi:hypothetical protein